MRPQAKGQAKHRKLCVNRVVQVGSSYYRLRSFAVSKRITVPFLAGGTSKNICGEANRKWIPALDLESLVCVPEILPMAGVFSGQAKELTWLEKLAGLCSFC